MRKFDPMKSWEKIKYRKSNWKSFIKRYVPDHLLAPEPGKFAIYHGGYDNGYRSYEYKAIPSMILEVNNELKILFDEEIFVINEAEKEDWIYARISNLLEHKTFAITGAATFPRTVYESLIELNGGSNATSITKKTTHLINSSFEENTKINAAKNRDIKLINEIEFFKMLEQ